MTDKQREANTLNRVFRLFGVKHIISAERTFLSSAAFGNRQSVWYIGFGSHLLVGVNESLERIIEAGR